MAARFSRPIGVRRLSQPKVLRIEADAAERAVLADELGLISLASLGVDVTLRPFRGEGVRVSGVVEAVLQQECVVTLEPVAARVREAFDVRLHPDAMAPSEVAIDPEADDPPERLEADTVDVGAIALEHFVLGLDPYPRAPGAEFEPVVETVDEPSPFAVLAALRKP